MKPYLKYIIGVVIIIIIGVIIGAILYENFSNIFGFLGLTSLNDKADRIRQLNSDLEKLGSDHLAEVRDLRIGKESLIRELEESRGREREAAESLDRERKIHREMFESIERGSGAIEAIRTEAKRILREAEVIDARIRILRQTSDKPDSALENPGDR